MGRLKTDMFEMALMVFLALLLIALIVGAALAGCADRRPTCADNPRNMQCFSADELQKELNQ